MFKSIRKSPFVLFLSILSLLSTAFPASLPIYAQEAPIAFSNTQTAPLSIQAASSGMTIEWNLAAGGEVAAASVLQSLETVRYNGLELPMRVQPVILPANTEFAPQITTASAVAWSESVAEAELLYPTVIGVEEYGPLQESGQLPSAPVFVMEKGRVRGVDVAVIAFSPIYQDALDGETKLAGMVQAYLPGARPLTDGLSQIVAEQEILAASQQNTNAQAVAEPPNKAAAKKAVKLFVSQAGMQRVSGKLLIDNGIAAGTDTSKLHFNRYGTQVAVEVRDNNGKLDANDEIRFYAPAPADSMMVGNYWNTVDVYWITVESSVGLRMKSRAAQPAGAPLRTTAMEAGIWESNKIYESKSAGNDGDHWFAKCMKAEEADPESNCFPELTVELQNVLPLATSSSASSIFTLTGGTSTVANHQLEITAGSTTEVVSWFNRLLYAGWSEGVTSPTHVDTLTLKLLAGDLPSGILFDKVYWQQPVTLDFGGQGAQFIGEAGNLRYGLSNLPANRNLYDVTNPNQPVALGIPGGSNAQFEDDVKTARTYLVTGEGTLHRPSARPHAPLTFSKSDGAEALYIAPANFHDELEPLVAHRKAQGYSVRVIDVNDIYDAWSYGQISPDAIRNMLRNAVSSWKPKPISFVLVGDGTYDARNYLGSLDGDHNRNIIPPYLADNVDPWLSQTACEVCYAQLDDDVPLGGETDPSTLIDIWGGRLSVQNERELEAVVGKILRYETAPDINDPNAFWRQTSVYVTDNYYQPNGTTDLAGNFPSFSEEIIKRWQPSTLFAKRMYFDPDPLDRAGSAPWYYEDANVARETAFKLFSDGPALFNTQGHSNHFYFAITVIGDPKVKDNWLFSTLDVDRLNNIDQLSIVLQMTCYTSQFSHVSRTGTTLDEKLMRHPRGGAVAVWGPAGLTVALGHDTMQQGFYERLDELPGNSALMGDLIESGYFKLFQKGGCCQDARKTYLLQGDPLMRALVGDRSYFMLPNINRQ